MSTEYTRRNLLKTLGAASLGLPLAQFAHAAAIPLEATVAPRAALADEPPWQGPPLTAIVAGAGKRGNVYASYAQRFPEQLRIVGVAEPIPFRRERFARTYSLPIKHCFNTWEDLLAQPKCADVLIISTPDALHYGPALAGLDLGYDVLLEKPIAQQWEQCLEIAEKGRTAGRMVGVCHVLRHSPFFRNLKAELDRGDLGHLISMQWLEPVGYRHIAHSYVRGNWRRTDESNPMLLAKSCHDLDMLRWLADRPCLRVASFGSLTWFKEQNAPAGSTRRCTDGCSVERECPFSAIKIYEEQRLWTRAFDLPDGADFQPTMREFLRTGPYGRCVYRCDNDAVDHQVVMLEFADGLTANFSMEGFTSVEGRRMRLMLSNGDIAGDNTSYTATNFSSGEVRNWSAVNDPESMASEHGGGDQALMRGFLLAVRLQRPELLHARIETALESHLMGFQAERSRASGSIERVEMPGT